MLKKGLRTFAMLSPTRKYLEEEDQWVRFSFKVMLEHLSKTYDKVNFVFDTSETSAALALEEAIALQKTSLPSMSIDIHYEDLTSSNLPPTSENLHHIIYPSRQSDTWSGGVGTAEEKKLPPSLKGAIDASDGIVIVEGGDELEFTRLKNYAFARNKSVCILNPAKQTIHTEEG